MSVLYLSCLNLPKSPANYELPSQAKLDSFEEDLNLGPNDFNLALAILNVG